MTTTPALPKQGNFLRLPAGAGTLTFRVRAVNTHKVRFYLTPTGTGMFNENQLIGQDTNRRDGWTLAWRYQDDPCSPTSPSPRSAPTAPTPPMPCSACTTPTPPRPPASCR